MIRIGHNPNTNMLPMFYFLAKDNPLLQWATAEPTGHNAMLASGVLDMAPISAFSYGEHWQEYALLPDLSVAAKGRFGSILFFSKVPIEDLAGKRVALTSASATSANLLKILLLSFYHVRPDYITLDGGIERMLAEADAALLIADAAIQASLNNPGYHVYDLGEEWLKHTGCAMVYAVWAFPQALIREYGEELAETHRLLLAAKEKALSRMDELIASCVAMAGGTEAFWREYFGSLSYTLDAETIAGLRQYFDLCYEEGLLPSRPELNFWP